MSSTTFGKIGYGIAIKESDEFQNVHPCFICESPLTKRVQTFPNFQYYTDSSQSPKRLKLEVYVCSTCNLIQNNPIPNENILKGILQEAGKSYGSSPLHMQDQIDHLLVKGLIYSGASVLDVGCYDGTFLGLLPDFIRGVGIDVDPDAIERGNARFKVKYNILLISSDFVNFQSTTVFNTIVMYHVLEHLVNPKQVLMNLLKLAKENTSLIVEVPILENGATNDINGFIAPLHLTHFSTTTLERMLNEAGWLVEEELNLKGYNGYRVVAKPGKSHGLGSKPSNDIELLETYLSHDVKNSNVINNKLNFLQAFNSVVIWGAGIHLELLFQKCEFFSKLGADFLIVDSAPRKWGTSWRGINIVNPNSISWSELNDFALLIANYSAQNEIFALAIELGVPAERILRLYNNIVSY